MDAEEAADAKETAGQEVIRPLNQASLALRSHKFRGGST